MLTDDKSDAYPRSRESAADFPACEDDEAMVRADLQYHGETENAPDSEEAGARRDVIKGYG